MQNLIVFRDWSQISAKVDSICLVSLIMGTSERLASTSATGRSGRKSTTRTPRNPLHVTLRCPVDEAQNRSLKRIGVSALVVFQEPQVNKPVDICDV